MKIAVSRAPGTEREVSPLELFFDLVYVFAIGQQAPSSIERRRHLDNVGGRPIRPEEVTPEDPSLS